MNTALMIESIPALLRGTWLSIQLLSASLLFGLLLAVPLAIARLEAPRPVRAAVAFYISFFRGTPLLVQIFLVYYGVAQFEFVRDSALWPYIREAWFCAVLTFSLHTAAYTANILRGAISAVPAGEIEAARAFGMSRSLAYRIIILPRAVRLALPAYTNEVVSMLKATSLASTITIMELTGTANTIVARTFAPYELFVTAAAIYLLITTVLTAALRALEYRLARHQRDLRPSAVIVGDQHVEA
ncbi:ABC transporter permease [Bosea sp. BIWAKO-01]|uniref:ABC transporter permease n=1 Tax=Bosea sp. BIWAKO-01 TaxID=506668 RepID=UPI000853D84A|nr:ABC transporter permease [Bosea sp. BIWAKO-01]GAU80233.1 arginine/ornithine ABC transporter permease protein AotM [Bosea sp. BIWAKO-01]